VTVEQVPPGGWDKPIPREPVYQAPAAGWWSRVGASLVDFVIISIPATLMAALIFGGIGAAFDTGGADVIGVILGVLAYLGLLVLVAIFYGPLLMRREGAHNGQTWGKQLFRIRVVRTSGAPMDFTWSACREAGVKGLALGFASTFIPLIPYLLDFLWPLWDDQNRAIHDMVMDTRVVRGS
jgi:uncharacterized RDD family membrane protein YckC